MAEGEDTELKVKVEVKEEPEDPDDVEGIVVMKLKDKPAKRYRRRPPLTEEEKAARRKLCTEKKKMRRERQSEEKKALEREKGMWRKRIRNGHPSATMEKIKELGERFGPAFSIWCEVVISERERTGEDDSVQVSVKEEGQTVRANSRAIAKWSQEKLEEYKKKKRASENRWARMSEEKLEEYKAKKREAERLRRMKMTGEKLRLKKEKDVWRMRLQRGTHPEITEEKIKELKERYGPDFAREMNMTPEQIEEQKKKRLEWARKSRERLRQDKERLEEYKRRQKFRDLEKKLAMTEEQKRDERIKKNFYLQTYYANKPKEYKDKHIEQHRQWRKNLTPEKRQRWLETLRMTHARSLAKRLGESEEKWLAKTESQIQAAYWRWVKQADPERWKKRQERTREYMRKAYQNESEEKRKERKFREKVNGMKRRLRKQLEQEGVDKEEIEQRLKILHEQKWKEFDPEWTWEKYGRRKFKSTNRQQNVRTQSTEGQNNDQQNCLPDVENIPNNLVTTSSCNVEKVESVIDCAEDYMESASLPATPSPLPASPSSPPASPSSPPASPSSPPASPSSPPASPASPSTSPAPLGSPPSPVAMESSEDTNFQEVQIQLPPIPPSFSCSHCTEVFTTDFHLRNHLRKSHFDKVWLCPKCREVILSPQELALHFQTVHKTVAQSRQSTSASSASATSKAENTKKKKKDQETFNFFCMRCPVKNVPMGFKTRLQLFAHVKLRHRKNFWPCDSCNIIKYSKKVLELHQTLCSKTKALAKNK